MTKAAGETWFLFAIGARTYDHLKKTRDEERLKRTMLSEVLQYIQDSSACQQWLSRQADMYGYSKAVHLHTSAPGRCRKHIALCDNNRFVPNLFQFQLIQQGKKLWAKVIVLVEVQTGR